MDQQEAFRLSEAMENGTDTPELAAEVKRNIRWLEEFKE